MIIEESVYLVERVGDTQLRNNKKVNINNLERSLSIIGGSTLLLLSTRKPSITGLALAIAGGALVHTGVTGYCSAYAAFRRNDNAASIDEENVARDVHVEKSVTINRSSDELYMFWRNFQNLPGIMRHVESVSWIDELRSHWVAIGPAGKRLEWDAEIYNEVPYELIAWRSLPGSDVVHAGSVHFEPNAGRGTKVKVVLNYNVPGGKLTALFAKPFGAEPGQMIEQDLRRFKQLMETGEIPTTEGQPTGVDKPSAAAERKGSKRAAASSTMGERPRTRTQVA
jgi:uncharacterized membrane protein